MGFAGFGSRFRLGDHSSSSIVNGAAQVIARVNVLPTSAVQLPLFRKGKQKGD